MRRNIALMLIETIVRVNETYDGLYDVLGSQPDNLGFVLDKLIDIFIEYTSDINKVCEDTLYNITKLDLSNEEILNMCLDLISKGK